MLTAFAILERELGAIDYERHRLRRRLAGRLAKSQGDALRSELAVLDRRRRETIELLDEMHAQDQERIERAVEGMRARAARSPYTRRETPEEARRRLGLPGR
jgi:hypothetical protein